MRGIISSLIIIIKYNNKILRLRIMLHKYKWSKERMVKKIQDQKGRSNRRLFGCKLNDLPLRHEDKTER